ncbi:hypothetical protein B551_0211930 [Cupriavidus sp. HPC(L)]|nr:hypothetical protein B551_0211930 [Cupriavidus sp. HPC(L)]
MPPMAALVLVLVLVLVLFLVLLLFFVGLWGRIRLTPFVPLITIR